MQARRQVGPCSWTVVTFSDSLQALCFVKRAEEFYKGPGKGLRLQLDAVRWMASKSPTAANTDCDAFWKAETSSATPGLTDDLRKQWFKSSPFRLIGSRRLLLKMKLANCVMK